MLALVWASAETPNIWESQVQFVCGLLFWSLCNPSDLSTNEIWAVYFKALRCLKLMWIQELWKARFYDQVRDLVICYFQKVPLRLHACSDPILRVMALELSFLGWRVEKRWHFIIIVIITAVLQSAPSTLPTQECSQGPNPCICWMVPLSDPEQAMLKGHNIKLV